MSDQEENILSISNIYRIDIPSPYSAETTNCYFIDGTLPMLIDTGVATEEAYQSLVASLSSIGRRLRDIKRIILTHGHADHRALAPRIAKESGADVFCHQLEKNYVLNVPQDQKDASQKQSEAFFQSIGVPDELLPPLVKGPDNPSINPRLDSVSFLNDGDEIKIDDLRLTILHTPGHSSGSICLYNEGNGLLFTGDTLLSNSHITASLETDMIAGDSEYNSLKLHIESLQRLLKLDVSHALPGHGPVFGECESIVQNLRERHRKRQRHILRSLRNGRRSPYQICRSTFLFVSPDDLYLALSEVMGNIGILAEEEKVAGQLEGDVIYYEKI